MDFLPYFEIRFLSNIDRERFDIFDDNFAESSNDSSGWDNFISIDYQKLSQYIQI